MTADIESPVALDDVVLYDADLPLRATLFPLGFPLELATNSEAVIAAARESWGLFPATQAEPPVSLYLTVTDHEDDRMPPRPKFRSLGHVLSIVSDARNHVMCDLSRGCAIGWVTRRVTENAAFLRLRFLESSVMTLVTNAYLAPIHGALVTRNGVGVILCGDSFAGKSTLSYACARSGWTFVSDDGTYLIRSRADRYAVGNPHSLRFREDAKYLFPELADRRVARRQNGALGMEIRTSELPIATATGCSIDHVVFLRRSSSGPASMNPLNAERAQACLVQTPSYGSAEVRAAQHQAHQRLLDAGAWELHYSNLSDAVELLEQL